jgi:hypothetical protein
LESKVETLESRYYEACVTLNTVIARLVELGLFGIRLDPAIIDAERKQE